MVTRHQVTAAGSPRTVPARSEWKRLRVETEFDRLTHYLFRYPAKFHPPVIRALLEQYTNKGDLVLDPFCGSGTLLVEARVLGRPSIGLDVDPVAVSVAQAKVHRYQIHRLRASADRLLASIHKYRRAPREYERRKFEDLSEHRYQSDVEPIRASVPAIPNLFHWFRRYVIIDLAMIRRAIEQSSIPETHKALFRVVFASIIRNASNADPVPVSGLEVTAHMRRRDAAGRLVDPFRLFARALARAIDACESFGSHARVDAPATVLQGDATQLDRHFTGQVDAVLCSPPYHGAVDYYRRHQLEMFWLGETRTHTDRLRLLHAYIGRPKVPESHPLVASCDLRTPLAREWEQKIRRDSKERANAFRHYLVAMAKFFDGLAAHVLPGGATLLVVGHSSWNAIRIPTTNLFAEIAAENFRLREVLWYPVRNRYMSYSRHNNASIDKEYVLVFERRPCG